MGGCLKIVDKFTEQKEKFRGTEALKLIERTQHDTCKIRQRRTAAKLKPNMKRLLRGIIASNSINSNRKPFTSYSMLCWSSRFLFDTF